MDPWYVTLRDDKTGYLYLGDDNQGEISSWSGSGEDFTMKAGISVFEGDSYLKDGILRLDFDGYVVVFLSKDADREVLSH